MYKSFSELGNKPQPNRDVYSVVELKDAAHKQQIISTHKVVLVDIFADWCGPCKQMAPDYAVLANKFNRSGVCAVVKENLDRKLTPNIQGVPTLHFFVNGRMVHDIVGADLKKAEEKLTEFLAQVSGQGMGQGQAQNPLPFQSNSLRSRMQRYPPEQAGVQGVPQPYQPPPSGGNYHMPNVTFHN